MSTKPGGIKNSNGDDYRRIHMGRHSTLINQNVPAAPTHLSDVSSIFDPNNGNSNCSDISESPLVFSNSSEQPTMSPKTVEAMKDISV